jgi:hypothetical protein
MYLINSNPPPPALESDESFEIIFHDDGPEIVFYDRNNEQQTKQE